MIESVSTSSEWGARTPADLSSLLVELNRALRGLAYYEPGHPARGALVGRVFLALTVELERAGTLELSLEPAGFRARSIPDAIGHSRLDQLARDLLDRGVHTLRFDPDIESEAIESFAGLLAADPKSLEPQGGFARAFAELPHTGIALNGDVAVSPVEDASWPPSTASPSPSGSPLAAAIAGDHENKPSIDEDPLNAAPTDERAASLVALLQELDCSADDEDYQALAGRIARVATQLLDEGRLDEGYRTALVLSDHAVGLGGRSGAQAVAAQARLTSLATGPLLAVLIGRASAGGIRSAQVLLQLGKAVVEPVLERLEREPDVDRASQLSAVLITLGEALVPALVKAIESGSPGLRRVAIRLAGESQHRHLVPTLISVVRHGDEGLAHEAAKALAQIGGPTAVRVLIECLSSNRPGLAEVAAYCLGVLRDPEALPPLLERLELACKQGQAELARELIRALGQLGRRDAVPRLISILEQRTFFARGWRRDLKLSALVALASLPGKEARRAIERAADGRDPRLSVRATQLLRRLRPSEVQ